MVSKDSKLYQSHPDWLLGLDKNGYNQPSGRSQFVLDLQNTDVSDYLSERLDALLNEHKIRYLKWDMNRELVQAAHQGQAAYHGQTLAFYRLVDGLRQRHPEVEIESCASGGGRIDYEVLKRCHRFWPSDCNDALERQHIQQGMRYFFPSEVIGSHIGPKQSHTTRRCHDMQLRGITAMFGHMGVELDPVGLEDSELRAFSRYIMLHKHYRPLLHQGQSFSLPSPEPHQKIYGIKDDTVALVAIVQMAMPEYAQPGQLRLPVLDQEKTYKVSVVDKPAAFNLLMKHQPNWLEKPLAVSGELLVKIGLSLPIMDPESAMLLCFTAIPQSGEDV